MNRRSPPKSRGPTWWRYAVSLLLIFHLLAVFIPPFAFQSSPIRGLGSPVAETAMMWWRPYLEAMYLNHGYAFFAPDPGPSHLLLAKVEYADGRPSERIVMPDLERHWPRLLYHRYFMLSEHLHGAFAPEEPPEQVLRDPIEREIWEQARARYAARKEAIERHLAEKLDASRVELVRVEHRLLDPQEFVVGGKRPADSDTYRELSERFADDPMASPESREEPQR